MQASCTCLQQTLLPLVLPTTHSHPLRFPPLPATPLQADLESSRRAHKALTEAIRRHLNPEGRPMKEWLQGQIKKEARLKELEAKAKALEGQEVRTPGVWERAGCA